MKKLITLMIMVLAVASLMAQTPEKFSYQAVVRNTTNQLVTNAPVSVRVSILQGSADGEALYVETHSAVTNANGLLTVEIGGGKAERGEFAGIDWANGPYFLMTETDPNGGGNYSITSTQQLLSVPYALYAKEAANSFSGDYNDLRNKPAIPQNVGELTNDAGYITLNDIPAAPKGGETNDAGVVQTTACGEIDLCEMANQLAQLAQRQEQMDEMRNALLPTVTTTAVSNITETTATGGGNVTSKGYSAVTARGMCYGTEPNPTVAGNHTSDGTGTGAFTSALAGLQPNTTYYVKAYAINSIGTAYGEEVNFTTAEHDNCATISLPYSEDFESYTTSTTLETGVQPECWELIAEDVALTNATKPQLYRGFATSGSYSLRLKNRCIYAMPALSEEVNIRDLTMSFNLRQPNSAYRLQVGVVDEYGVFTLVKTIKCNGTGVEAKTVSFSNYTGTSHRIAFRNTLVQGYTLDYSVNYIDDITINGTVSATLPTVITGAVSEITATTAIGGGEVTADGGAEVTGRGVCWSTEPNPTVEGNNTSDGTGTGEFISTLADLQPNTTYYVRAYATNREGTVYGEEVSFTTAMSGIPAGDAQPCPGAETVTDIDGNVYNTVKIGEQCWTRENLRTTHYANGEDLPHWSYYFSDDVLDFIDDVFDDTLYGYFYSSYIISSEQSICPTGWHVPSSAEWTQLIDYVSSIPGYRCGVSGNNIAKALAYTERWMESYHECTVGNNQSTNNASGFAALPIQGGLEVYFTSSQNDIIIINYDNSILEFRPDPVVNSTYFLSVRCLRDEGYPFSVVTTTPVRDVTLTSADCGGEVVSDNGSEVTERGVCWSTESSPTVDDSHTSAGSGMGTFIIQLTDLSPSTTYYVRAYAINSLGTSYGEEMIFTTLSPDIPVGDAQPCPSMETLTDYDGNVYNTVKIGQQCWMKENLKTTHYADGTEIQFLSGNTEVAYYYSILSVFRFDEFSNANPSGVQGVCPNGWHVPSDAEWTQLVDYMSSVPAYQCDGSSNNIAKALASTEEWHFSSNTCAVGNNLMANNASGFGAFPVGVFAEGYFEFSLTAVFWSASNHWFNINYDGSVMGQYHVPYNDAYYNDTWYNEAYQASVRCLRDESEPVSLTDPTVITLPATNIQATTATLNGSISNPDNVEITEQGFEWKITENGTYAPVTATGDTMTYSLTGLAANTGYTYRAFVTMANGTIYGDEVTFTTTEEQQNPCAINALPFTENFESYTTSTTTETGVQPDCWEVTTEDVTLSNATKPQLYRGFATSGSYSLRMKNRCVYAMPVLREDVSVRDLTMTFNLRQPNSAYRLQVGVVDESGAFTLVKTIKCNGTGIESKTVDFSNYTGTGHRIAFRNTVLSGYNLDYSINYIDDITFDIQDGLPCPGAATVTDIDGNTYSTVKIGDQCWMRENLRTTHYADGTSIPAGGSNTSYTEPYYYDYSSHSLPLESRGYLYNWPAAMHGESSSNANPSGVRGICPSGWHLPSDAEWTQLENYVGSQSEYICGGGSAKALASTEGWYECGSDDWCDDCAIGVNSSTNNASGFSAVPAGEWYGGFDGAGGYANFWSSTEDGAIFAWGRYLGYYNAGVYRGYDGRYGGFSVRCLRD